MIPGAEPIALGASSESGVLLLHGFGDTPQTLLYLARRLHAAGFTVRAPLYPGHGTSVEDFFSSTAEEWIASAREALISLRDECSTVSIVGLSMGAAIAAILAGESHDVASVVLLAPYLKVPAWVRVALGVRWIWNPFVGPIESRHPRSIQDPEERARSLAYGVVNASSMSELSRVVRRGRAALPEVIAPTLVVQSREDPRVSGSVAALVIKRIGAREKRLVWTEAGGHVITVDFGRERVFAEALDWITKWGGQPQN